jgi:translation initiation factor 6 (eIF-6)
MIGLLQAIPILRPLSCSVFEAELQDVIPICHATIAGTRIVGRLTAGYVNTLDRLVEMEG